ncbi:MAG: cupredoxin domain-containing protein [Reyranella sp.]|nr:cupredoxin domain-containing protein [Reyranella sp.]
MKRRAVLLSGLPLVAGAAHLAAQSPAEVRISARKFEYHPPKVTVKRNQPVVLVLTSEDRIHGFKMPDFGLRTDIVPGQETRVPLMPDKAGSFTFFCDVFCGDGHEDMDGTIVVEG